jgi:hypothetical protein
VTERLLLLSEHAATWYCHVWTALADQGSPSRSALAGLTSGAYPPLSLKSATITEISYAGYRFPPVIIQQAIW